MKSSQSKWNTRNRHKLQAHHAVRVAIRQGALKRGRCEVCGSFRVDGHHQSYHPDDWLKVVWLCRKHHQLLHANQRKAAG